MAVRVQLSDPTPEEAARFGLTVDEARPPPALVWPDNLQTVNVFVSMSTQWLVGLAGPTGLNYASLPVVMRSVGVTRRDWPDVFDGLRTMEDAALGYMHRQRK